MRKPYVTVAVYVMIIATFCLITSYSFFDETRASTRENRNLETLPSLTVDGWFSGEFATRLNGFFSDHVFGRETLVALGRSVEGGFERRETFSLVTGNANPVADAVEAEQKDTVDYLLLEDRILQVFRYQPELCDSYTTAANDILGIFSADTNKYLMVAPTRIAFEEQEYAQHSSPQKPAIERVYESADLGVEAIDVYDALEKQKGQLGNLYFRLDHHWTQTGSYLAAQAMWEQLGKEYPPIEWYERHEGAPFLGYLYAVTGSHSYEDQYDELVYYLYQGDAGSEVVQKPTEKDSEGNAVVTETPDKIINPDRQGYYTFLSDIYRCVILDGRAQDGSGLLIVGDSYANAFAPWMTANYEKVVVVDPRFYDAGKEGLLELANEYHITDVLVLNCSVTMNSPYFISCMETLS
jgi:hypothetical protein